MVQTKLLVGEAFTDFSIEFAEATTALCAQTYRATQKPPPREEVLKLVERADRHINEYRALLDAYSAGRRDAILEVANDIKALEGFANTLRAGCRS